MHLARVFLTIALLLGACTGAPVGGPLPGDLSRIASARDAPLAMHAWPARGPARAVILGLHGFGDTGELAFAHPARSWNDRGIAVYAVDQRGFGANPSRKRWPGGDALVADAVAVAGSVRRAHPRIPLVVVGHSMGGGVALAAAAAGMDADALVLVGPAIAGGDALNPLARAGAWTLAAVAPETRWTGAGLVEIRPTDNPDAIRRVLGDPRHFGDPSSRELYGLVRLMDRAAAAAPAVGIPTLTLMGAHDEVLRPSQVRRVHERIPGGVGFVHYPDGWHWLLADRQAPRVWQHIADFALAAGRRPGGGPSRRGPSRREPR